MHTFTAGFSESDETFYRFSKGGQSTDNAKQANLHLVTNIYLVINE